MAAPYSFGMVTIFPAVPYRTDQEEVWEEVSGLLKPVPGLRALLWGCPSPA